VFNFSPIFHTHNSELKIIINNNPVTHEAPTVSYDVTAKPIPGNIMVGPASSNVTGTLRPNVKRVHISTEDPNDLSVSSRKKPRSTLLAQFRKITDNPPKRSLNQKGKQRRRAPAVHSKSRCEFCNQVVTDQAAARVAHKKTCVRRSPQALSDDDTDSHQTSSSSSSVSRTNSRSSSRNSSKGKNPRIPYTFARKARIIRLYDERKELALTLKKHGHIIHPQQEISNDYNIPSANISKWNKNRLEIFTNAAKNRLARLCRKTPVRYKFHDVDAKVMSELVSYMYKCNTQKPIIKKKKKKTFLFCFFLFFLFLQCDYIYVTTCTTCLSDF
jgi:hypothetical protein